MCLHAALAEAMFRRSQGASTALAAMQSIVESKDAEIAQLRDQMEQAVDNEKARWASTFTALVSSVKEPFQSLQTVCIPLAMHGHTRMLH